MIRKRKLIYKQSDRLAWMKHYEKYKNARFTCRFFGLSPDTFYRWKNRYNPDDSTSLIDGQSRTPIKSRRKWNMKTLLLLKKITDENPNMSFQNIKNFFDKNEINLSIPTIFRMKKLLKKIPS